MKSLLTDLLGILVLLVVATLLIVEFGGSNAPLAQGKPITGANGRSITGGHAGFIAGTVSAPTVGEVLTSTNGTWTNSPSGYTYAWDDCNSGGAGCVPIGAATSSTYTIVSGDVGHEIASFVTATNSSGSTAQESNLSGVVTATSATCSFVASTTGSDSNVGSVASPFLTAQKLISSLTAGHVGCLRGGTYSQDTTFDVSGTSGAPITLTSYPGETATVTGRMYVDRNANYVTVTGLYLNGTNSGNLPSPTINSANVTFSGNDITDKHTAICFNVGDSTYGIANNTLITANRIHDCGVMPANNHEHGIYVSDATNTVISWNLIYNNADRGIQLYPHAQTTTIDHNIIDNNGEGIIISGDGGQTTDNSNIYDNSISNAQIRYDVESYWPAGNPIGTNNLVYSNCVWAGAEGTFDGGPGYTAYSNTTANPLYVNAAAGNYAYQAGSPCSAITGDVQGAVTIG